MTYRNVKRGRAKKINYKRFIFVFVIVSLLLFTIYFLNSRSRITGKAILNIEANYQKGEPLQGTLRISLKEGELIPVSSKVIFETINERYEYTLGEIIDEKTAEGNFYVERKSISGNGLGYGILGKKIIYPPVSFTLGIYSEIPESPTTSEEQIITEEQNVEKEQAQSEEIASENESVEENVKEQEITPETTEQNEIQEPQSEIEEEQPQEIVNSEEAIQEPISQEGAETPITGSVVGLFGRLFNLFQGMITGRVSMEIENIQSEKEIQGEVSKDKPFTYTLEGGQIAKIISSSHDIKIFIENNVVTVTTDYFEEEEGFGADYLGDGEKTINIDLSKLNLILEQGELSIILVYEEEEIVSLKTFLKEGISAETEKEEVEKEIVNESVEGEIVNESITEELSISLSDEEKEALFKEFGNSSIKMTAKLFNDRVIVRHELGDKWIENSYDANLNEEELELQMEADRIKWLKDIAKELLQEKIEEEELEKFKGDYQLSSFSFYKSLT